MTTQLDVHGVTKVTMRQTQFKEPFSFHTIHLECDTGDGQTLVVLYSKEKLTFEKASR